MRSWLVAIAQLPTVSMRMLLTVIHGEKAMYVKKRIGKIRGKIPSRTIPGRSNYHSQLQDHSPSHQGLNKR